MSKTAVLVARLKDGETVEYRQDVTDDYNEAVARCGQSWELGQFEEERLNAIAYQTGFVDRSDFLCWITVEII